MQHFICLAPAIQIKCKFASFEGCELHGLKYTGDEANTEENLNRLNALSDNNEYTYVAEFMSEFHTSANAVEPWEADKDYNDYPWWLAKKDNGGFEIVSWGDDTRN